jgi:acyl carrier protein
VTRDIIQKRIREYIIDNFLVDEDEEAFGNEDSFLESGLIDSTGMLEVITYVEETFEVEVADEEMTPENLDSVDNISRLVAAKLGV